MDLAQTRRVAAPPERVWQALIDPEILKACIPGCETFERIGDNEYKTMVAAKIGPVSARFNGRMQLADVEPPSRYTLRFEGQGGAAGFARGSAHVALTPAADAAGTDLTYTVKAQVGGKLAQVGSRLVDGAAAKLADDFFARFAERVGEPAPGPAVAEEGVPAEADAGVPPRTRWIRYAAIAILIAIILYLYSRGTFKPF